MTTSDKVSDLFSKAGMDLMELAGHDSNDESHPAFDQLYMAAVELIRAGEDVRQRATEIRNRLDQTLDAMGKGYHLGGLGTLQASGPAFDVEVALYQERLTSWNRIVEAVKSLKWERK
jgi:hypothetical protein